MKNRLLKIPQLSSLNFEKDGVEIRNGLISRNDIDAIKKDINLESSKLKKYGVRNLEKRFRSISNLAKDVRVTSLAGILLKGQANLVRAIFFDKTPDKNWYVKWHQDKTVTLNKKMELDGWGPWSTKDNVQHVQPPVAVLNNMVTIRLHIDPADERNGCLKVIPGTHKRGILSQTDIDKMVESNRAVSCTVETTDAVVMRPHILHSSSKAEEPSHRRVVHLEYSSFELPDGASWA